MVACIFNITSLMTKTKYFTQVYFPQAANSGKQHEYQGQTAGDAGAP
jgi:hypothetical protein